MSHALPPVTGHGILADHQIQELLKTQVIRTMTPIDSTQIQPASMDLRLGPRAWHLSSSFLPSKSTVEARLVSCQPLDLSTPQLLARDHIYLVELQESLALPYAIKALTNPKSTIGRLDIFVRVLCDYSSQYDRIPAGYHGKLYLEIIPRSFAIRVHAGAPLTQIRFQVGHPTVSDHELATLHHITPIVFTPDHAPVLPTIEHGLWLTLDANKEAHCGYRAKPGAPAVDLTARHSLDPTLYWDPMYADAEQRLVLDRNAFYILKSREAVRMPPNYAGEMIAIDPSLGEMRAHFAGFFDPGFGHFSDTHHGTPAVLEIRAIDIPFMVEDGQAIGRILFEHLLQIPQQLYGGAIGSSYQGQTLALSKQFAPWPTAL